MVSWEKIFIVSGELSNNEYKNLISPGYGNPNGCIAFLGNEALVELFFQEQFQSKIHAVVGNDRALVWLFGPSPQHAATCNYQLVKFSSTGKTLQDATIPFGLYELKIPAGASVKKASVDSMVISSDMGCAGAISFSPKDNPDNPAQLDQKVYVSLGHDGSAGDLGFSGSISGTVPDASVRYFYKPKTGNPLLPGRFLYPAIQADNPAPCAFKGTINPGHPFNHKKNHLLFLEAGTYQSNFSTTLGHSITLTVIPGSSGTSYAWDPVEKTAYTVLKGKWQAEFSANAGNGGSGTAVIDLMAGLSGVEFAKIPFASVMEFVPGAPAYAPGFLDSTAAGAVSLTAKYPGSAQDVTTSWVWFNHKKTGHTGHTGPSAQYGYYTQPETAGLYTSIAGGPAGVASILEVFNLRAAVFPAGATGVMGAPSAAFPMAPYGGVTAMPHDGRYYTLFEHEILTPARSKAIYKMDGNQKHGPSGLAIADIYFTAGTGTIGASGSTGPTGPSGPTVPAVTPQGLLSTFTPNPVLWQSLLLAQTANGSQSLAYTEITTMLQAALLTNQLFLVVSDPAKLQQYCSVMYQVTPDVLYQFNTSTPPPPPAAQNAAALFLGETYFSYSFFQHEVNQRFAGLDPKWGPIFIKLSEFSQLTISGWQFNLAPHFWVNKTILIIKFADKSTEQLIDNLSQWTMAGEFNDNPANTQKRLQQIVASSQKAAKTESEFDYFVNTVLADSSTYGGSQTWNGVLYLDCAVPPNSFPPQLRGLAAGIDESKFRAHHLGINISSIHVEGNNITVGDSSLFGLIDYQDTKDLVYNGNPYDFKVLTLRVLFANSQITSFASQIELLVAELFAELCTLQNSKHGNNLILNGIWQKHGTQDSYAFIGTDNNLFTMESQVLDSVIIDKTQFITIIPEGGFKPGADIATEFLFWGRMRFKKLPDFDLFSFGPTNAGTGLVYSNLMVAMKFSSDKSKEQSKPVFAFLSGGMVFDLSSSAARPGSLYLKFPLQVTAMLQGTTSANPPDMGFLIVDSPLPTGSLGSPWFGLQMDLSLGSPGGLAAKTGFTATLLAAWAPGKENANVAIGLKLPGSEGSSNSLRIEGPLKLDIGSIRFFYNQAEKAYLMKFQDIALSFLSLKFPPGGQTNILLFGDPDPQSSNSTLGWYAAYKKDEDKKNDDENNDDESGDLIRILEE